MTMPAELIYGKHVMVALSFDSTRLICIYMCSNDQSYGYFVHLGFYRKVAILQIVLGLIGILCFMMLYIM